MSKTAEEILNNEISPILLLTLSKDSKDNIIQAMRTYAEQRAVEFAEWVAPRYNTTIKNGFWSGLDGGYYSTYDLYKLFTQQNQK